MINYYARRKLNYRMCVKITRTFVNLYIILYYILVIPTKSQSSSHEMVRTIDTASDSPIVFHAADTSCNRSSDAQISLHNLVPITDSDASHIHCTLNCICKKDHDILYHGTMYHTPLNNTQFSIDAYNALIASIYLHQYFCILKILAHSVDFNELYRNVTIHCPSFSLVR